ncbi:cytochrome c oxidase assembly protein [Pseudonocardia sp. MH-G8]|uniref:cytochrome c oxidase assembly protein n=1 Tax=Pseudonocardia sp. MH-G8 TaxID=1854588 RepID=UPI000BA0CEA1|nr:cytochrome c oxidase assembly protein [Pseudonocardia sp. MH-G8]OZM77197.1 hypothetical protein CFP66_36845 [Pseudonocardia sp. MH-G8]
MTVLAHDVPAHPAEQLLLVPGTLLALLAVACYARGTWVMRRHRRAWRAQRWRLLAGWAGIAVTAAAVAPPVERFTDDQLFTHMLQHMTLIVIAAPLLALAPGRAVWIGLPRGLRTGPARWLHRPAPTAVRDVLLLPAVAWSVHVGALWAWHLPAAYDAALHSAVLHATEHALFLGTAWLFWWHALTPSRRRLSPPLGALYLATAMLPMAALGAILTFAPEPLYPAHATGHAGADALTDQQLAGLIMWIPADVIYFAVAVALFLSWFIRGSATAGPLPLDAREDAAAAPVSGGADR